MNCKSANVVYGLGCNLCGLVYVGETKGKLHKRICSHRSGIINNVNDIVYQYSILSMRVRIIEKYIT
jgi:predicted GIY-YIG superfamily endonuclease